VDGQPNTPGHIEDNDTGVPCPEPSATSSFSITHHVDFAPSPLRILLTPPPDPAGTSTKTLVDRVVRDLPRVAAHFMPRQSWCQ
jgi:hypothetical protein